MLLFVVVQADTEGRGKCYMEQDKQPCGNETAAAPVQLDSGVFYLSDCPIRNGEEKEKL